MNEQEYKKTIEEIEVNLYDYYHLVTNLLINIKKDGYNRKIGTGHDYNSNLLKDTVDKINKLKEK